MTLDEALVAWRKTRHPRWAEAVETLGKQQPELEVVGAGKKKADTEAWNSLAKKGDVHDLPRLFAAALTTSAGEAAERVKILAKLDDPRLTTLLLAAFEAPPWRANVFKDFVKEGLATIQKSGDVRAREQLKDLAPRYKAIIETSVGDWVGTQLTRAAEAMEKLAPKELSAADEKKLAALPAPAATKKKAGKSRSDEELLALIYASPDDDQPRLVFADALTERGDARGEFISLQLARARGNATPEQLAREEELVSDPKKKAAWSLPLANGGDCTLVRGFPERIKLKTATAKKILGDPAWATIRTVDGLEALSVKLAVQFLEHPTLANVRAVSLFNWHLAAALELKPRAWTKFTGSFVPTAAQTASWSALEHLTIHTWDEAAEVTAEILAPLAKLRTLGIGKGSLAPRALSAVPHLRRLELSLYGSPPRADLLAPLTQLESLRLWASSDLPMGDVLSRVSKTVRELTMSANYLEQPQVEAGLAAMPNLERLELHGPEWASVELITKLISRTKIRSVSVTHDLGTWELKNGTELTLHWLAHERPLEKVLGPKLPKSVKTTHFPNPYNDAARERAAAYFAAPR